MLLIIIKEQLNDFRTELLFFQDTISLYLDDDEGSKLDILTKVKYVPSFHGQQWFDLYWEIIRRILKT